MKRIRVLGLGSPAGDDQLGWRVTAELERSSFVAEHIAQIEVLALDRSHATLLELMAGAEQLVLVDAVRTQAPPGTVLECQDVNALHTPDGVPVSEWPLADSLQLAAALQQLPMHWTVLATVIDAKHDGPLLSDAVFASVPVLVERIEQLLHKSVDPMPARCS